MTDSANADTTPAVDLENLDNFADQLFNKTSDVEASGDQIEQEEEVHNEDSIVEDDDSLESDDDEGGDESHEEAVEDGDDSEDGHHEEPKKRRSVQERINEITREKYEAERRELETLRQLAELKNEVAQLRNPQKEEKAASADDTPDPEARNEDGEPKYPLGEFDPGYIRDLTRHTLRQEQAAAEAYRKEAEAKAAQEASRTADQQVFTEKFTEVEKEIPDLRSRVLKLDPIMSGVEPAYNQYLVDIVRKLENGPRVLAYLADNPETAQKIVKSGAAAATIALGRLDFQVSKSKKQEARKVTAAPEPPVRTPKGSAGSVAVSPDTDNLDDFSRIFFKKKR